MRVKIIAAIGENNELGNKGGLPLWNLKTDMERFKILTTGGVVVMGRKTFESFPEKYRPLPNRRNIVLTRDKSRHAQGAESFESLEAFLETSPTEEAWVIGGGEIYKQYINKASELHITHVKGRFPADTFFPIIDPKTWRKVREEVVEADGKNSHGSVYAIYAKRS
jgi:dihydrofolate reductase